MTKFDFGPDITRDGVSFRLWAPLQQAVQLEVAGQQRKMDQQDDGWHHCSVQGVGAGERYAFILQDGLKVPDPASRFQPDDVHGASEVVDLESYRWSAQDWKGRPWEDIVIYELHVGTFTQAGTFVSAIERLDHLKQIGVTAIQLMPISDFPGRYGWGYDGVLPYAPDSSYGRPEHLMALVDAAHALGICVFLDVVYNHFGPQGNYLPAYAPIFTHLHETPWGDGINYDDAGSKAVREFVIQNALYWITEFRLDGLRLDAVHAIKDDSHDHLLHELARRVRAVADDRLIHLIVENEDNNSALLERDVEGEARLFTAQWNDDIHHVLHIAATGETFGYYADYADGLPTRIGRALAEGFVFQGEHMPYRGEVRGMPSGNLPPTAFIAFIQNHDQIGNRARGDRMIVATPIDRVKMVAALYLLAPQIPMLFMGEEWGAREPFPYFCDFDGELNEMVIAGRREELSRLPGFDADEFPDPTSSSTFASAKLDWSALGQSGPVAMLDFYKKLIEIRHHCIVPLLKGVRGKSGTYHAEGGAIAVDWALSGGRYLHLRANLSAGDAQLRDAPGEAREIFRFGSVENDIAGPFSVVWSITE